MIRSEIAKTISVVIYALIAITLLLVSYMLYEYDYVGNCSKLVSIVTFFIQCLFNVAVVLVFRIIHYKINS